MKKISLTYRILIGLAIGVVVGLLVNKMPASTFRDQVLIGGIFEFVGQVFLRLIMMLVVPLVFVTLVHGVQGMEDIGKLGRIGVKTVVMYLLTSAIAIVIALVLGNLFPPAKGINLGTISAVDVTQKDPVPLVDVLTGMFPKNVFQAFGEGNMLQIIVFAILFGIGMSLVSEKIPTVKMFFAEMNEIMLRLIGYVMKFAPIGVFGLIAKTFGQLGVAVILPVAKYVGLIYVGLIIQAIVVYGFMLKVIGGVSPTRFYKKYSKAMGVAFSTASSNATLPLSLEIATEELGIDPSISSFTLPLGATINMNGTAIMQGIATLFIAQAYGLQLTIAEMATVVLTATLASVGTAGVPGAGALMLSLVLQSIGLPLEGMGLILGVDRLVDMGRTTINVTGDSVCTVLIAKSENLFNREVYDRDVVKKKEAA